MPGLAHLVVSARWRISALISTRVGVASCTASPAYFAGHGVSQTPEDLTALTAVTFEPLSSSEPLDFFPTRSQSASAPVQVRSRLTVNTAEALDGATAGLGVTRVLSCQVDQPVLDGKIEIVLADYEHGARAGQSRRTPVRVDPAQGAYAFFVSQRLDRGARLGA